MTFLQFLQAAREYFLSGGNLYFCAASFALQLAGKLTPEDGRAYRDRIHALVAPSINYWMWLEDNHPAAYERIVKNGLELEARLAWCDHLIQGESNEDQSSGRYPYPDRLACCEA